MKKTKRVLKSWLVKVLSYYLGLYIMFVGVSIDNVLDNKTYDIILLISTILAFISFYLLMNYSNVFED